MSYASINSVDDTRKYSSEMIDISDNTSQGKIYTGDKVLEGKTEERLRTESSAGAALSQVLHRSTKTVKFKAQLKQGLNKLGDALPAPFKNKKTGVGRLLLKGLQNAKDVSRQLLGIGNAVDAVNEEAGSLSASEEGSFSEKISDQQTPGEDTATQRRPAEEVAYRTRRGSLHHFSYMKPLGQGTFNQVDLVNRFSADFQQYAFRFPLGGAYEMRERQEMLNTDTMLNKGHSDPLYVSPDGTACGIQRANHAVIYFCDEVTEVSLPNGTLSPVYADGDLFDKISSNSLSTERKVDIVLQLAFGVANLHHTGYFFGDIKPENVLIDGARVDHADIGGRQKIYNKADFDKIPKNTPCGLRTPRYVYAADYELLKEMYDQISFNHQVGIRMGVHTYMKKYNQLMEAMDVTANAAVAYLTLTGQYPYAFQSFHGNETADLNKLDLTKLKDVPNLSASKRRSLEKLFIQAFDPDYRKRPSSKVFAEKMAQIFPKQAGDLLAAR